MHLWQEHDYTSSPGIPVHSWMKTSGVSGLAGLVGRVKTSIRSVSMSTFLASSSDDPSRGSISGELGPSSSDDQNISDASPLDSCVLDSLSDFRDTLLSSVPSESPTYLGLFRLSFFLLFSSFSSSSEDDPLS